MSRPRRRESRRAPRTPGPGGRSARTLIGMALVVVALFVVGFTICATAGAGGAARPAEGALGGGTAMLALTLGVRHAFDADHITAIDNTARKLRAEGGKPLAVGFFFALGHSTVVLVFAAGVAIGARALNAQLTDDGSLLHGAASVIGTGVSAVFLYLIGFVNLAATVAIVKSFRKLRAGQLDEAQLERQLQQRGLLNRVFGRFTARLDASWKMYPLGVLFGLGLDTATEITLLVVSAAATVAGLPWWALLCLPLLFAAGMCLFDTLDGILMSAAYGWAFLRPVRKIYYNVFITALSAGIALLVGTTEVLIFAAERFGSSTGPWRAFAALDLNGMGFVAAGLLVVTWVAAMSVWRLGRFEERWEHSEGR